MLSYTRLFNLSRWLRNLNIRVYFQPKTLHLR